MPFASRSGGVCRLRLEHACLCNHRPHTLTLIRQIRCAVNPTGSKTTCKYCLESSRSILQVGTLAHTVLPYSSIAAELVCLRLVFCTPCSQLVRDFSWL
jgi:hypothetical protein